MFIQAFNYKKWADDCTLSAIEGVDKERFTDSYAFMLQQINHMVIVEELFKSRLMGDTAPHKSTNSDIVPALDELKERLKTSGVWYASYVSRLVNGEKIHSFKFADGQFGKMSVEEILFHIINHGSYHRGNIAHALDLACVPHPIDGYGIYIHEKEPERRKPS